MKAREMKKLGIPSGEPVRLALEAVGRARVAGLDNAVIRDRIRKLAVDPASFREDATFRQLARELLAKQEARSYYVARAEPAPYRQWGENLEPSAVRQLELACTLPVAVRGALMPDAHIGYGLPIGGVLATRNAVIPTPSASTSPAG